MFDGVFVLMVAFLINRKKRERTQNENLKTSSLIKIIFSAIYT